MVKVKGPCFSLEAHGSLADCLTYQDVNSKPVVKSLRFPTYRCSPAQAAVRDTFSWATLVWRSLPIEKRNQWAAYKDIEKLVGYAAFLSQFLRRTYQPIWQFELPPSTGFCVTGNFNVDEAYSGGAYLTPDI
jgi:hypothetical protein